METQTLSAASQSGKTRQSAGMEKAAPSRPGQFSQILKRAESSRQERSITPASATLSRPVQPRSSFFMQNMSIEQRRSAVEEKGFSARPAAMERVSASMAVQAGRSKETGAEHSHPPGLALGSTLHKPYASGHEFETNGAAQKHRVKEAINDSAELKGKRSINPTWLKIGKALSCEVEVRSSTAARLRNPQPKSPLAGVPVRGAATHKALGRWLWQSRPSCKVEHWPSRPWACR